MKCEICNHEVKNLLALSTHIQFKHENRKKEYYNLYMKKEEEGFCKVCGNSTNFRLFSTGYSVYCCKECEKIDYSERMKNSNPMKNKISQDNQRKTNQKRYGVNQNTQRSEIKKQIKKTNFEKYGVKNVIQVKEFQKKAKKNREKTCLRETGFKYYFMVPEVQKKIRTTFLKKYGYENLLQCPKIRKKIEDTCLERFGVRYPLQNKEVFERIMKNSGHAKKFGDLYYRGSYEKDFLEKYYNDFDIHQGLVFNYHLNNKDRIYYSDFYLPKLNLIIEIKNQYHATRYKEIITAKKAAVLAAGYDFIMIINKNYYEFEKLFRVKFRRI